MYIWREIEKNNLQIVNLDNNIELFISREECMHDEILIVDSFI